MRIGSRITFTSWRDEPGDKPAKVPDRNKWTGKIIGIDYDCGAVEYIIRRDADLREQRNARREFSRIVPRAGARGCGECDSKSYGRRRYLSGRRSGQR